MEHDIILSGHASLGKSMFASSALKTPQSQMRGCRYDWAQDYKPSQFADFADNIRGMIDFVLYIPATPVEAEQGFSVTKRVKTDIRNKLKTPALQDLLRIMLLSPSEAEFDPKKAINHWTIPWTEGCQIRSR
ncbi:hypothetical protein LSH36_93g01053 [Paralvinella palmiformis]|uniref:HAT C-terminal dimerisation domain-containing protein n=1 Tax=Paralvinella palmiformis TaxID=53620 RepID=A0AAD9K0N5_9ANNE|nr:hypothetical protein LSH36_93g01053 [Paralvinella palmiformis]